MLILRTLLLGPAHGHQIAEHIRRNTEDVLRGGHVSLYPASHRLERRGWLESIRESTDGERQFKYYRLSVAVRKQLAVQVSKWKRLVGAIAPAATQAEG